MYRAAWWTCALIALSVAGSQARIYQRCELARDLRALGVHPDHISTWVCIAYHESRFDTAANNPHSGDHGIFQISELYWCGAGKACGLSCSALRDDNIADDLECALQVHEEHTRLQGDGFLAWVVYPQHCKQSTKKYLIDCEENLKNASVSFEGRAFSANSPYSNEDRYRTKPTERIYTNNPNIDALLPPYLTISSIFRASYGKVLDHNKFNGVDWYNYKYDNIDDLKLPDFKTRQPSTTSITTTTTASTTPYIPPVKPWRFIETNQFRKKTLSPEKSKTTDDYSASEKNDLSYSTDTPTTKFSNRQSFSNFVATAISPKVMSTTKSHKSVTSLTSTVKPMDSTDTAYKLPVTTASYKSRTTTNRPSTISYISSTASTKNFIYKTPSAMTTTIKPTFPPFVLTFRTTKAKPETVSTTAFTFPPWAFKSRNLNTSTSTLKPPTTFTPTTTQNNKSWYTFATRANSFGSSAATVVPQNELSPTTPRNRQATKSLFTSSTQKQPLRTLYSTTTQKPFFFTTSTTQKPSFPKSFSFFTASTTQRSPSTLSTSVRPNLLTLSTTQRPTFFTTSTRQKQGFTSQSTQRTTRATQNIFDLYLNPTKTPQLPSFSFSSFNSKSNINIFSGGTTTTSPFAKRTEELSRPNENRIKKDVPVTT